MTKKKQDFTDIDAIKEKLSEVLSERGEEVFPSKFRRFLKPIIPDPNQLSIPSEPVVRGTFTDRMQQHQEKRLGPRTRAQATANMLSDLIGTKITLSAILNQLESLPSSGVGFDFDILSFGNEKDFVSELDILISKARKNFPSNLADLGT